MSCPLSIARNLGSTAILHVFQYWISFTTEISCDLFTLLNCSYYSITCDTHNTLRLSLVHTIVRCLPLLVTYSVWRELNGSISAVPDVLQQNVRYQGGIHIAFGVKFKHPVSLKGFRTAYITILVGEDEQIWKNSSSHKREGKVVGSIQQIDQPHRWVFPDE